MTLDNIILEGTVTEPPVMRAFKPFEIRFFVERAYDNGEQIFDKVLKVYLLQSSQVLPIFKGDALRVIPHSPDSFQVMNYRDGKEVPFIRRAKLQLLNGKFDSKDVKAEYLI